MTAEIIQTILDALRNRRKVALVTLCSTDGSTPRKAGAKMLVFPEGNIMGTIGGGSLEYQAIQKALTVLDTGQAVYCTCNLDDLGMVCGGRGTVYIECFGGEI
ncbi:XdhC family protein [Candidatus Formimonas warabiya]|uniref:XdhC- CoxI domain-containing protein n=1 Tax=Formimonas warabiya TaxID=1761012 RepID=A0A3G1KR05_FORW1|nr:XdhC family protein [Candidatus Formimonas warabiya]ATW24891.1 hypothetical protein DCMF_09015 [Candidatus Formimonas warabiya]